MPPAVSPRVASRGHRRLDPAVGSQRCRVWPARSPRWASPCGAFTAYARSTSPPIWSASPPSTRGFRAEIADLAAQGGHPPRAAQPCTRPRDSGRGSAGQPVGRGALWAGLRPGAAWARQFTVGAGRCAKLAFAEQDRRAAVAEQAFSSRLRPLNDRSQKCCWSALPASRSRTSQNWHDRAPAIPHGA